MNRRMVFYTVGRISLAAAVLLLLPALAKHRHRVFSSFRPYYNKQA